MPTSTTDALPAVDYAGQAAALVNGTMTEMKTYANAAVERSNQIIDALLGLEFLLPLSSVPHPSEINTHVNLTGDLPVPEPSIDELVQQELALFEALQVPYGTIDVAGVTTIPAFQPSVRPNFSLREPAFNDELPPVSPTIPSIVFPLEPVFQTPATPQLSGSQFTPAVIPNFDIPLPVFAGGALPSGRINFNPGDYEYVYVYLRDIEAQIKEWFENGGLGIPPNIEQAIYDRAVDRAQQEVSRAEQKAYEQFGGRGFRLPTGLLQESVRAFYEEARKSVNDVNRTIIIEAQKQEVDHIHWVTENMQKLEEFYFNVHNEMVKRAFELAKLESELQITAYNSIVALFQAQVGIYNAQVEAYNTRVQAALAVLEENKLRVEFDKNLVNLYESQWRGVLASVDVYKAQVQAKQVEVDIVGSLVNNYKIQVDAYSAKVGANKQKVELYTSQVQAEGVKAGILESEAKVYSAEVSAINTQNEIQIKNSEVKVAINDNAIRQYTAEVEAKRSALQSNLGVIQAQVAAYQAKIAGYAAGQQTITSKNELAIRNADLEARTNIAYFEARMKEFEALMARFKENAAVVIESLKTAGVIASSLASGALSAINVSGGFSGNGQTSFSQGQDFGIRYSYADDVSYSTTVSIKGKDQT